MITYAYWFLVFAITLGALIFIGFYQKLWKVALAVAASVLVIGWGAYFFHYQQIFVKNWGGKMAIKTPEGRYHLGTTWKDDNLWVETYDPSDNTCHFNEYSRGDLLQGEVIIRNCSPELPRAAGAAPQ